MVKFHLTHTKIAKHHRDLTQIAIHHYTFGENVVMCQICGDVLRFLYENYRNHNTSPQFPQIYGDVSQFVCMYQK